MREGFMKKLGLMQDDADLDAAVQAVMKKVAGEHDKHRVTVYYLLAEQFGKLGLFVRGSSESPSIL